MENPLAELYNYFENHNCWASTIELKRDEWLHQPGMVDDKLYYVEQGTLYYTVTLEDDRQQIIRFGYQGDFIAAMDSFLSGRPTIFDSRALQKCRLNVVKKADYVAAFKESEQMRMIWDKVMRGLYISQLERELDLLTTDATERYLRVWRRSPRLFQEIPAKYIANYLGMSPETLSRIRANTPIS